MNPYEVNMDSIAEEHYAKWDPEYYDDDEEEEEEDEEIGDCDEFDIAREDALIFDEGVCK